MALSKPTHNVVNLPLQTVFVPIGCYVSALKLSLQLALELREKCDEEIHRVQVEEIDEALVEVGEGRPALQAVADRAKLVRLGQRFYSIFSGKQWERQSLRVSRREYEAVQLGQSVKTRGAVAKASMKTHEYQGRYFVRLEFEEPESEDNFFSFRYRTSISVGP